MSKIECCYGVYHCSVCEGVFRLRTEAREPIFPAFIEHYCPNGPEDPLDLFLDVIETEEVGDP